MRKESNPSNELLERWRKDPNNWKLGIFYYNKVDKRIFPPKRNKYFGWTVNFANRTSIIILLILIIALIAVSSIIKTP